jgi:hypothetical protein
MSPLAQAGIPVFVVSTFNTDYLLVKLENLTRTVEVLRKAGQDVLPFHGGALENWSD